MRKQLPSTPLGPRTWRAAVIVFLAVFIGGLMVSGAAALWSQQTTANLTLTTGTWEDPAPASVPLDVEALQVSFQPGFQEYKLSWLPTRVTDRQRNLSYTLSVVHAGGSGGVREVGPILLEGVRHTATVRVDADNQAPYSATFSIAITPAVDGVPLPATTRVLTINRNNGTYSFS